MTHAEFVEWMAFYQTEPFGDARGDIHAATVSAVLVNIHRKKSSRAQPVDKFIPDYWKDSRHPLALAAKFRTLSANIRDDSVDEDTPEKPQRRHRS